MNTVLLQNNYVKIELYHSILVATWQNISIDTNIAKDAVKSRLEVSSGISYPVLINIKSVIKVTKEARDFLASEEGCRGVTASAIVVNSALTSMIGNFFIRVSKPLVPTRLFTDENAAIKWLSAFKSGV